MGTVCHMALAGGERERAHGALRRGVVCDAVWCMSSDEMMTNGQRGNGYYKGVL